MEKIISFPLIGNYYVPSNYIFRKISNCKVIKPPPITNKTIELGNKYSPSFVCTPFKYTLGTYIESLEMGANILIQLGGGCRYGYYFELQEQILNDLNYNFKYYNLISRGNLELSKIYKILKEINPSIKPLNLIYYVLILIKMIKYIDKMEDYIRKNKAYEIKKGCFDTYFNNMLKSFSDTKNIIDLEFKYLKYKKLIKGNKLKKPKNNIKIGIIGELYTVMEPFANNNVEDFLHQHNIEIKRFTNATYLLFKKHKKTKKYLKKLKNIKYRMGADAMDNIYYTKYLIKNKYDGIIHIKSSFCTPEIGSMGIINKICEENNMPVIFFSMDSNTSKVGFETRLEAFYDMIEMRKNNE